MIFAILLMAFGLLALAAWSLYAAINLVPTDIGLVQMQVAAILGSTGTLLLGLAAATRAITRRLGPEPEKPAAPVLAGDRPVGVAIDRIADEPKPAVEDKEVVEDKEAVGDKAEEAVPAAGDDGLPPLAPLSTLEMVRTYESGGTRFTMYSDGSFVSSNEEGEQRFRSLDELRAKLGPPKAD